MAKPITPFDARAMNRAADEWRANCGPAALAAVTMTPIQDVRQHMAGFLRKGYTNPTLMRSALQSMGFQVKPVTDWPALGLVRVQWHGPWMNDNVPIRARYRHTHWIGSCVDEDQTWIFDVNAVTATGGWLAVDLWTRSLAPWIIKYCVPNGDGQWSLTHLWEVSDGRKS